MTTIELSLFLANLLKTMFEIQKTFVLLGVRLFYPLNLQCNLVKFTLANASY